ncbi:MAG: HesA/MoeB/ThiF family protein [Desulfatiglandaceae bacterium]
MENKNFDKSEREIKRAARPEYDAAGRPVTVIEDKIAGDIAEKNGLSIHEIYHSALSSGICPMRYLRNLESITLPEQFRLSEKTAAIVGAGGLGGNIITLLARLGVGTLIIIDPDSFDETNLNRQALSGRRTLGYPKAQTAAAAVADINPGVKVISHQQAFTRGEANTLLHGADVILDGLDNIIDRIDLQEAACDLKIPFIHGAIAGFEGQVMTVLPGDAGLKKIYGERSAPEKKMETPEALLGTPAPTPALIAALQVMEALKILLDRGKIHRHALMHVDMETFRIEKFSLGGDR